MRNKNLIWSHFARAPRLGGEERKEEEEEVGEENKGMGSSVF